LRRALGKDVILYDKTSRRYLFNRSIDYTYDVEEFTRFAQLAKQETDPELKAVAYQKAVEIYRHPFAPNLNGVWTEPVRRNLFLSFEHVIFSLADYHSSQKCYSEVVSTCRKLLEVEICQEEAYRRVLIAYSKMRDRTNLIRVFEEYKSNMLSILQLEPSSDTHNLYKELIEIT
jgi:two-component SAPR family response regulator